MDLLIEVPFMISVRQASDLPPASSRSHLAVGTLALGYILPATGRIRDFHPLERAPAGRTIKRTCCKIWILQQVFFG